LRWKFVEALTAKITLKIFYITLRSIRRHLDVLLCTASKIKNRKPIFSWNRNTLFI